MTDLSEWIGSRERKSELVSATPLRLLASTLDLNPRDDWLTVPPLWHWLYFHSRTPRAQLGEDGHPRRGLFLPPVALRRRMYAEGHVRFHQPIPVDEMATQVSEVADIRETEGRSGPLVLVEVAHRIETSECLALEERQVVAYTDSPPAERTGLHGAAPKASWSSRLKTDPVLLFRFSALTFNSHRIHYDQPYTTEVEGYPDLVVHGPLTAILLAHLATRHQQPLVEFGFRATSPAYVGDTIELRGDPDHDRTSLTAYVGDRPIMKAWSRHG